MEEMGKTQKNSELLNRQKIIKKLNKWNTFRVNKEKAIDIFVKNKKKQLLIRWLIINVKLVPLFKKF